MKILIADDSEADVYLIREALKAAGLRFEAEVATTGEQAIAFVRKMALDIHAAIDAMILDLNLTTHGGIEILELVRTFPNLDRTPVVILTSSEAPVDMQRAQQLGVDAYMKKAMDLDEFMQLGKNIAELFTAQQVSMAAQ